MKLQGIPASPGIALGPAYLYEPEWREVSRALITADQAPEQWYLVEGALAIAWEQISLLRDAVARRVGAEEAAIFDAHLLILEDDALLTMIHENIDVGLLNAEAAAWDAFAHYRDLLLSLDDEYLRARAMDLDDICGRVISCLRGEGERSLGAITEPSIIVARDLLPSDTASLDPDLVLALVTEEGGPTAHTAILARQLGIPAVVAAPGLIDTVRSADTTSSSGGRTVEIGLDGATGEIEVAPDDDVRARFQTLQESRRRYRASLASLATLPAVTPDGHALELMGNVGTLRDVPKCAERGAHGVGLFRSEFLFLDRQDAPTEDEQVEAYRTASEAFPEGYVIVRTLDVGGDKKIPYLPQAAEQNPFLGLRGLRLCLAPHFRPTFKTQLRAILKAAAAGARLRVMFPMVNLASELHEARAMLTEIAEELEREGVSAHAALQSLPIGAMVETPAAACTTDLLSTEADFFSIGTNDLTQYVLAVDRMNSNVAPMYDCFHPSVLRAIAVAVTAAHSHGRTIGMCGEMAGDPLAIPFLLGLGLDELSMTAEALPEAKQVIRACPQQRARDLVDLVFRVSTAAEVRQILAAATSEMLAQIPGATLPGA